jgi:hypothetical protein
MLLSTATQSMKVLRGGWLAISLCLTATPVTIAQDAAEIPAAFRGTWSLRLTSSDGGKTYLSGDNKPICEVSATEIKFLRKFDFADEKLTVKTVKTTEANGQSTWHVTFTNGKVWRIVTNSGSITSLLHDSDDEKAPEKYRFVTRILR